MHTVEGPFASQGIRFTSMVRTFTLDFVLTRAGDEPDVSCWVQGEGHIGDVRRREGTQDRPEEGEGGGGDAEAQDEGHRARNVRRDGQSCILWTNRTNLLHIDC